MFVEHFCLCLSKSNHIFPSKIAGIPAFILLPYNHLMICQYCLEPIAGLHSFLFFFHNTFIRVSAWIIEMLASVCFCACTFHDCNHLIKEDFHLLCHLSHSFNLALIILFIHGLSLAFIVTSLLDINSLQYHWCHKHPCLAKDIFPRLHLAHQLHHISKFLYCTVCLLYIVFKFCKKT